MSVPHGRGHLRPGPLTRFGRCPASAHRQQRTCTSAPRPPPTLQTAHSDSNGRLNDRPSYQPQGKLSAPGRRSGWGGVGSGGRSELGSRPVLPEASAARPSSSGVEPRSVPAQDERPLQVAPHGVAQAALDPELAVRLGLTLPGTEPARTSIGVIPMLRSRSMRPSICWSSTPRRNKTVVTGSCVQSGRRTSCDQAGGRCTAERYVVDRLALFTGHTRRAHCPTLRHRSCDGTTPAGETSGTVTTSDLLRWLRTHEANVCHHVRGPARSSANRPWILEAPVEIALAALTGLRAHGDATRVPRSRVRRYL